MARKDPLSIVEPSAKELSWKVFRAGINTRIPEVIFTWDTIMPGQTLNLKSKVKRYAPMGKGRTNAKRRRTD